MTARRLLTSAVVLLLSAVPLAAQAPRVRLNIDDPRFNVALYEKAMQKLKDRDPSKDDPNDPVHNSYTYFQKLHNGSAGQSTCQHQNEIFLTWHRALLALFEKALQATYPGETDNLMLPYWNYGAPPSGTDFPKPFEVKTSPLYNKDRDPGGAGKKYTTAEMRTMMLRTPSWSGFNGGACVVDTCDGQPCAKCDARFGSLESPYHNQTHNWVGGPMLDDSTAAEDPIFWSFHTYIDLQFACWQKTYNNPTVGCPDCPLRAIPGNVTPSQVATTAALGYTYDWTGTVCAEPTMQGAPRAMMMLAEGVPTARRTSPFVMDFTIPAATFATAHIRIEGLEVFADYNYAGHVYLYPAGTALATSDEAFRKRYLVGDFAVWGLAGHANHDGGGEVTADVDASTELDYLAKKYAGAKWKIAIVVDPPTPQYRSTRKGAAAEIRKQITFDDVSVIYDRDYAWGRQ